MKLLGISVWIVFFTMTLGVMAESASPVFQLEFYSQPGCRTCERLKQLVFPELRERYPGQYRLVEYDTSDPEHFRRLLEVLERFQDQSNATAYLLINQSVLLTGPEIEKQLFPSMERLSASPTISRENVPDAAMLLSRKAASLTVGMIVTAGLIDGLNPCVFSTLVFFISFLMLGRFSRIKIFSAGICYCTACFVTYLLLGWGLLYSLQMLTRYQWLRSWLDWLMFWLMMIFAVVSFLDAIRFQRVRQAQSLILCLPSTLRTIVHRIIRQIRRPRLLLPGVFLVGVLVTLLESVCTGQVYLPTLVLMTKETAAIKWFLLLVLYNVMFIIPLVVVFGLVYRGFHLLKLVSWSKKQVIGVKILFGVFFLLLSGIFFVLAACR